MDPTVMMTSAERPHGEVQLSFKYEARREMLLVKVIRARDLSAKDLRGQTADPYVRVIKSTIICWFVSKLEFQLWTHLVVNESYAAHVQY